MRALRIVVVVIVVAAAIAFEPGYSLARTTTPTSLNESEGCGAPSGVATPLTTTNSSSNRLIPSDHEVRGPWASMFGRDFDSILAAQVRWEVPMSGGHTILVHEIALPAFQQVTANLAAEEAKGNYYSVRMAAGFVWRRIGGNYRMSNHAFGTTIDINWDTNPFVNDHPLPPRSGYTDMPEWFVNAWKDAGFCWGGDWVNLKDAMHFSWQGPQFTSGYGDTPPPHAPDTAQRSWKRLMLSLTAGFTPGDVDDVSVIDAGRDGGPDIVGLSRAGEDLLHIDILHGYGEFANCSWERRIAFDTPSQPTEFFMADVDGDGRADAVGVERKETETVLWHSTYSDGYRVWRSSSIPLRGSMADRFAVADYDRDGISDLYVTDLKDLGYSIRVLDGDDGWQSILVKKSRSLPWTPSDAFVGDRDGDGLADLLLLGPDGMDSVAISLGSKDYRSRRVIATGVSPGGAAFGHGDVDGDGRDDILRISTNGEVDVFAGGTFGGDPMFWVRPVDDACSPANYPARGRDLNGDHYLDAIVGAPGDTLDGLEGAGAAFVTAGSPAGLSGSRWSLTATDGDLGGWGLGDGFGTSVASGDFDGDGYADLLIGIPGRTIDGAKRAGAVGLYPGDEAFQPSAASLITADSDNVPGVVDRGDAFGSVLETGDFDGDGYFDAVISSPWADVGGDKRAGAITILYGSTQLGLLGQEGTRLTRDSDGIQGEAAATDKFGFSLASGDFNGDGYDDLAVGTPQDDEGPTTNSGTVHVIMGSATGLSTSESLELTAASMGGPGRESWARFGHSLGAGDVNGDGIADLAVGAPQHGEGGAVWLFMGGTSNFSNPLVVTQSDLAGSPAAGDQFGFAVAILDMDDDGFAELAISSPGESISEAASAGGVHVISGESLAVSAVTSWWLAQGSGLATSPEPDDRLGSSLGVTDLDGDYRFELVIGVPGESIGDSVPNGGAVHFVTFVGGSPTEVFDGPRYQGDGFKGLSESEDRFGSAT